MIITGNFAPQGIIVVVKSVSRLSLSEGKVLTVIRAGTPQPEPIKYGMKARPLNPNQPKTRSKIKAARVIYPHSSSKDKRKNNITICGTKPKTAPTPPIIPSVIRDVILSGQEISSKKEATLGIIIFPNNSSLVQSVTIAPSHVTDM